MHVINHIKLGTKLHSIIMSGSQPEVHGWEGFFEEVSLFLESLSRQYGTANERYSHYAVERLGICIQSMSRVREQLHEAATGRWGCQPKW